MPRCSSSWPLLRANPKEKYSLAMCEREVRPWGTETPTAAGGATLGGYDRTARAGRRLQKALILGASCLRNEGTDSSLR